jgi:hypothetical protein
MSVEQAFLARDAKSNAVGVDEKYRPAEDPRCALPPAMKDIFYFQYDFGEYFLARLRARLDINAIFRAPPRTTAAIIHPEKYRNNELPPDTAPPQVPLDIARGRTFHPVYAESLGEFVTRVLLRQYMSPKDASMAALRWNGDRLVLYTDRRSAEVILGWRMTFASAADSKVMYAAVIEWIAKRFRLALPQEAQPFWATTSAGQEIRVARAERELSIFIRED